MTWMTAKTKSPPGAEFGSFHPLSWVAHYSSCLKPFLSILLTLTSSTQRLPPCRQLGAPGSGRRQAGRLKPLPFQPSSLQL